MEAGLAVAAAADLVGFAVYFLASGGRPKSGDGGVSKTSGMWLSRPV